MANRKISDLTALTAPVTGDLLPIVDISEAAAADKNKKITYGTFLSSVPLGTAAAPSIAFTGDNTGIYSPGADQLAISTNGTGRLFVDASGNVGFGTTPTFALDIAVAAPRIRQVAVTGTNSSFIQLSNTAGSAYLGLDSSAGGLGAAYGLTMWHAGNYPLVFGANNAERLRITSAGLVGIGNTGPGYKLDVSGDIRATNYVYANATFIGPTLLNTSATDLVIETAANSIAFRTGNSERARVDPSGRLLVGTSTSVSQNAPVQIVAATTCQEWVAGSNSASDGIYLFASRSRGTAASRTVVQNGDNLARLDFNGYSAAASAFKTAAEISSWVDGEPDTAGDTTDMPGRLVFSVTPDGTSTLVEALRITNDRVLAYNQPTPATYAAAATLTVADLKTKIITYTGTTATLTLPTGTLAEGGFNSIYTNMAFEWSVINTGAGICTIGAGTDHTIVGSATVAIGGSARFASRRTAANTFVSYRLS